MSKRKMSYEEVNFLFEKEGYTLLTKDYKGVTHKLEYICPNGHNHYITMMTWNKGSRCCKCRDMLSKKDFNVIKKSFEDAGYILLTDVYTNSKQKLQYICPNGHKYHTHWNMWQQGHQCPYCNGSMIHIDDIKKELLLEGYKVTVDGYASGSKVKYICNNGHSGSITMSNWRSGRRCLICSGNSVKSIDDVKLSIEEAGYYLISDKYINAHTKLLIKCNEGHTYKSSWHNWQSGKRCPVCPTKQSKFEKEIRAYIEEIISFSYTTNDKTLLINPITLRRLELDIYIPELRKAIECNGNYWHSKNKVILRDKIKEEQCIINDIDLLVITDNQWVANKDDTKRCIKHFLRQETE